MIELKEITTKKEMKQFVTFPFSIYKNNKNWVPPLISDEIDSFDKNKNPVFEHASAKFFVALKNNTIVGRIVAIINSYETEKQNIKKMRFGWFDVIDDIEVSKALLNKVIAIGKENNLEFVEGPVGFSNLDKTGILTEGYDYRGTMITWYNHPYYKTHLEQLGFKEEKRYIEGIFPFSNINPDFFIKATKIIKKRYQVQSINFTSSEDIMPYVDEMFKLFEKTYAKLSTFVPISDKQITFFKKKYIGLLNPKFIKFILDKNGKMIAFGIVMPAFAEALQKSNGKLFPFGFLHLLKAKKQPKDIIFYLVGVAPEYQNKGITAVLFNDYYHSVKDMNIRNCIRTPELEENIAIHQIWKNFNSKIHKKRSTYRLNIK